MSASCSRPGINADKALNTHPYIYSYMNILGGMQMNIQTQMGAGLVLVVYAFALLATI